MELVLGKEGEPIHSFLLVFAELNGHFDGHLVICNFATIEELNEEIALLCTLQNELLSKARWIW
jgi:hypothetical protein